ncbi:GntR family transcriptional regulator [Streptomyces sp. NPDC057010]
MTASNAPEARPALRPYYQLLADDLVSRIGSSASPDEVPTAGEISKRYLIPHPTAQFVRRAARTQLRSPRSRYAPPSATVPQFTWQVVAGQLRAQILGGGMEGRLPNRPTLAVEYRVSVDTVSKAVQQLEREGLVISSGRHGTYVLERTP